MSLSSTGRIAFRLNGRLQAIDAEADARAIDIFRDDLGLMGVKKPCGIGGCGSCAILFNGSPANSCLLMAWQIDGGDIITPEGLGIFPETAAIRSALASENAFQCGYCAPGHTIVLTALLREDPSPTRQEIIAALAGNICRCTGYHSILRGVESAVAMLKAREPL